MTKPQSTAKIYTTIQGVKVAVWLCVSDIDIVLQVEKEEVVDKENFDECGCSVVGIDCEEGVVVLYGDQKPDLGINVERRSRNYYAALERDDETPEDGQLTYHCNKCNLNLFNLNRKGKCTQCGGDDIREIERIYDCACGKFFEKLIDSACPYCGSVAWEKRK